MTGITGNFNEFFRSLDKDIGKWDQFKLDIVKGASQEALANLQTMSPIDTGRFRAAHTVSINERDSSEPREVTVEERQTRAKQANPPPIDEFTKLANEKRLQVARALSAIPSKFRRLTIWITNNVIYGIFIENGSYSKDPQAPRKLYAKTREKTEKRINEAIAKGLRF